MSRLFFSTPVFFAMMARVPTAPRTPQAASGLFFLSLIDTAAPIILNDFRRSEGVK